MKKLDYIIIGIVSVLIIAYGIVYFSFIKIKSDEDVTVEVKVSGETIYSISLEDDGLYRVLAENNKVKIFKNDIEIKTVDIKIKDFDNSFEVEEEKIKMVKASCNGKDCMKMYISKNHLLPIICTNGLVLNPIGKSDIDEIV